MPPVASNPVGRREPVSAAMVAGAGSAPSGSARHTVANPSVSIVASHSAHVWVSSAPGEGPKARRSTGSGRSRATSRLFRPLGSWTTRARPPSLAVQMSPSGASATAVASSTSNEATSASPAAANTRTRAPPRSTMANRFREKATATGSATGAGWDHNGRQPASHAVSRRTRRAPDGPLPGSPPGPPATRNQSQGPQPGVRVDGGRWGDTASGSTPGRPAGSSCRPGPSSPDSDSTVASSHPARASSNR